MEDSTGLLDDIASCLSTLPGKRKFISSVLISQPRKSPASIFPYAPNIHDTEIFVQDIVILVAEQLPKEEALDSPAVYVCGLEAVLYTFPATCSAIVYISKVDSTGQGIKPSPTKTIVLAVLEHISTRWFKTYVNEEGEGKEKRTLRWNVWVQLFARAQNQYLFPASIEFKGKNVLSDIGLVKWWKGVLEDYIKDLERKIGDLSERRHIARFVVMPGLTPLEVSHTLRIPIASTGYNEWVTGHPYSQPNITYPLGGRPPCSISQLIPYFPDDPKARLLDEVANTTTRDAATESSPPTKRRKLEDGERAVKLGEDEEREKIEQGGDTRLDYLRTVSGDEFWERMDGRQECRLGTVAFFATYAGSYIERLSSEAPVSTSCSCRPKHAEVTVAMLKKVTTTLDNYDFGDIEKAARSTEALQESIKSLAASHLTITSRIPGVTDSDNDSRNDIEEDVISKYLIRTIEVDNPGLPVQVEAPVVAQPVNILAVRKKKKPPI